MLRRNRGGALHPLSAAACCSARCKSWCLRTQAPLNQNQEAQAVFPTGTPRTFPLSRSQPPLWRFQVNGSAKLRVCDDHLLYLQLLRIVLFAARQECPPRKTSSLTVKMLFCSSPFNLFRRQDISPQMAMRQNEEL